MNDKEKRFTEEKIKQYQNEIIDLGFKINRSTLFAFLGLGVSLVTFAVDNNFVSSEILHNAIGVLSGASVVANGVSAVKSICTRASLEHTVRMLEYQRDIESLNDHPKVYSK